MGSRMSIYLPGDLKSRMEKAAKRQPINWSKVAVEIFEQHLTESGSKAKIEQPSVATSCANIVSILTEIAISMRKTG